MMAPSEEFGLRLARMSEAELMTLARDYDSLTDRAQAALRREFRVRGLEPPDIDDAPAPHLDASLITLRTYRDLSEAIVARSLLESAGIYVELRDENLVRLDWQVSNFIGGMRLQVKPADEAAAMELLAEPIPGHIRFDDAEPEFTQPTCPRCGSMDISFNGSGRGAALTGLYLLGLPLPLGGKTWSCAACGATWKDQED